MNQRANVIGCWILNAGQDWRFVASLADTEPSQIYTEPALRTETPYPQAREFPVHCALPSLPEDDDSQYPGHDLDEINAIRCLLLKRGFGARERQRRRMATRRRC